MHANAQERGTGTTRRDVLRWLGGVAEAGALGAVGASGRRETAHAKRHGIKRHRRHHARPQSVRRRGIESAVLAQDLAGSDGALAGGRCKVRVVCYPDGVCHRRRVCW
jgi:hypothetical protein